MGPMIDRIRIALSSGSTGFLRMPTGQALARQNQANTEYNMDSRALNCVDCFSILLLTQLSLGIVNKMQTVLSAIYKAIIKRF
jgi:hypothetical protein